MAVEVDGVGDGGAHGRLGTHVAFKGDGLPAQLVDQLKGFLGFCLGIAIGNGDVGAGSGEFQGDGAADAACAAGDQCRFSDEGLADHGRIRTRRSIAVRGSLTTAVWMEDSWTELQSR